MDFNLHHRTQIICEQNNFIFHKKDFTIIK